MDGDALAAKVTGIAALDHPVSRGVYLLGAKGAWVSRDDVAAALDVPRSVAAFHLDKLVDAGLLEVRFERRTGRRGPGAGRPAKLYRRAAPGVELSLPERRYDLAGALLAQALEATAAGAPVGEAVARVAHDAGRRAGAEAADDAGRPRRRPTGGPSSCGRSNARATSRGRPMEKSRSPTARSTTWPRVTGHSCAARTSSSSQGCSRAPARRTCWSRAWRRSRAGAACVCRPVDPRVAGRPYFLKRFVISAIFSVTPGTHTAVMRSNGFRIFGGGGAGSGWR